MEDFQQRGDELEAEADRLENETRRVEEQAGEARREWEAKKSDESVPGAQPAEDEPPEGRQETGEGGAAAGEAGQ